MFTPILTHIVEDLAFLTESQGGSIQKWSQYMQIQATKSKRGKRIKNLHLRGCTGVVRRAAQALLSAYDAAEKP